MKRVRGRLTAAQRPGRLIDASAAPEQVTRDGRRASLTRLVVVGVLVVALCALCAIVVHRQALAYQRAEVLLAYLEGRAERPAGWADPAELELLIIMLGSALAISGLGARFQRTRAQTEDLERQHATLRQSVEELQSLVWNVSDVIVILNADGRMRYQSPAAERLWGYRPEALTGRHALDFVHPDDLATARSFLTQALQSPRLSIATELRLLHADGSWCHFELVANNLLADPRLAGIVVTYRDITERKGFEEALAHQAFYDQLTQLPNRALFMDRLRHALSAAESQRRQVAVLFLDLDNFKFINDSLGHEAGDQLLIAVAERLKQSVRRQDSVARFGGDEFTILVEGIPGDEPAAELAERIADALRRPFEIEGREFVITTSVGIASSDPTIESPDDLLRSADLAMYQAKNAGKARFAHFDQGMGRRAMQRLELETELRRAVERGSFRVFYQPIVCLTDNVVKEVEALVRWEHPERGIVSPAEFVPLAEETGLILPIGRLVLREACLQVKQWQAEYPEHPALTLSVNLSARQFQDPHLVQEVADTLASTGFDPSHLKLEITESVLMHDAGSTERVLQELKGLGIRLAVDDFGTGYSSLAYLQRFPVDVLKIDRAFVGRISEDSDSAAIVRSIVSLAKTLNLEITAEGIETADQLAHLRALDCNLGQGYFFSRPLPSTTADILLLATLDGTSRRVSAEAAEPLRASQVAA